MDPSNDAFIDDDWHARRMSDEELLDRALAALEDTYWTLIQMHQRHGTALEDICCRASTGDAIHVLAEGERREEQRRA